ncbi:MAG TPA: DNA repair exonuclease [Longimicrobiales bacterium]
MLRLLHLADVHLGASFSAFGRLAASRQIAVLEAFRSIPELAKREGAHAVLIAGDLFDRPQPPGAVLAAARETLRRMVDAGLHVFIVPGNHDPITVHPHPYRELPPGVCFFTEPVFGAPVSVETPAGPLNVYGIAFDPAKEREPLRTFRRADLPGAHVVLLHGSVQGTSHWSASPNVLKLTADALSTLGVDYIALGDHHRPRPPHEFDAAGSLPACYSGSFAALDLTETGPRGCVVADIEPGRPPVVRHVPFPIPRVEDVGEVDVSALESDAAVADAVAAALAAALAAGDARGARAAAGRPGSGETAGEASASPANWGTAGGEVAGSSADEPSAAIPVARLVGTPAFPLDPDRVRDYLAERFGHAGVRDESHYYASARLDALEQTDTVAGHVVRLGRRRIASAATDAERRVAERALRIALSALEVR